MIGKKTNAVKKTHTSISKGSTAIEVEVVVFIKKEGKYYVAYCPALEVSSYGDDENEAKDAFDDAMSIFIKETVKRGTLEKMLLQFGWTLTRVPKINYSPPPVTYEENKIRKYFGTLNQTIIREKERIAIPV